MQGGHPKGCSQTCSEPQTPRAEHAHWLLVTSETGPQRPWGCQCVALRHQGGGSVIPSLPVWFPLTCDLEGCGYGGVGGGGSRWSSAWKGEGPVPFFPSSASIIQRTRSAAMGWVGADVVAWAQGNPGAYRPGWAGKAGGGGVVEG